MTTAIPPNRRMNVASVCAPIRPSAFTSVAEAMPVMMRERINGMTVIRMALTQSVPTGATLSASCSPKLLPVDAMAAPAPIAAPSATRTRVLSFIQAVSKCSA
jgi:hypothetical protein